MLRLRSLMPAFMLTLLWLSVGFAAEPLATEDASTFQASTPAEAVVALQKAIDTADQALFDRVVHMESLVGQCIDVLMEDAESQGQDLMHPALAMILSTVKMSEQAYRALRATLIGEAASFVRYGVRSGAFAGKKVEAAEPTGLLASVFADTSLGRKEILRMNAPVSESDAVYISMLVKDHGNGNIYPVEAWLREEKTGWRIIGLRNVRTLVRILSGEKQHSASI